MSKDQLEITCPLLDLLVVKGVVIAALVWFLGWLLRYHMFCCFALCFVGIAVDRHTV